MNINNHQKGDEMGKNSVIVCKPHEIGLNGKDAIKKWSKSSEHVQMLVNALVPIKIELYVDETTLNHVYMVHNDYEYIKMAWYDTITGDFNIFDIKCVETMPDGVELHETIMDVLNQCKCEHM